MTVKYKVEGIGFLNSRRASPKKNIKGKKDTNKKKKIRLYCDASFYRYKRLNKIEAGWGVVIDYGNSRREFFGVMLDVANSNTAELIACINAIKLIKVRNKPVVVYTDSLHVVRGYNSYLFSWMKNNWKSNKGNIIEDKDRWIELFWLTQEFEVISIRHTKGHADCEGNLRADFLAKQGRLKCRKDKGVKDECN